MRRMSLVQAVIELIQQHWPLSAALEQVASTHPLPGDSEAPPQFVAQRTLEDWYYAFKKGGFEGLKPKAAVRPGQTPATVRKATAMDPGTGSLLSGSAGQTALPAVETSRSHAAGSLGGLSLAGAERPRRSGPPLSAAPEHSRSHQGLRSSRRQRSLDRRLLPGAFPGSASQDGGHSPVPDHR